VFYEVQLYWTGLDVQRFCKKNVFKKGAEIRHWGKQFVPLYQTFLFFSLFSLFPTQTLYQIKITFHAVKPTNKN